MIQTTSQRELRLTASVSLFERQVMNLLCSHWRGLTVPACGLKITAAFYGLGIRGECLGLQIRRGKFDSSRPCQFSAWPRRTQFSPMPDDVLSRVAQRRIWVGKGSVRWFNFNGASHKSSALAFEAKGDGALPSAPTRGLVFWGLVFSRIHRGATGSRGKLKPFMLWVRIPPMEPPQVVQLAEAADLKFAKYGFESLLGDQCWRGRTAMHRPRKSEDEVSESSASSRNIFANGEKLDIHTLVGRAQEAKAL